MATETFHISSPLSQAEAFAMLADLTRVNEWDRGVTNAQQVEGDGPALGAKYEVTVTGFDGKPAQVVYELTEFDAPNRFVMIGEHATFRAHDTLTLTSEGDGCSLEYVGSLELMGEKLGFYKPAFFYTPAHSIYLLLVSHAGKTIGKLIVSQKILA